MKYLFIPVLLVIFINLCFAENTVKNSLHYYYQGDFLKARQLAQKNPGQSEDKFVYSLCLIHDNENQDLAGGLKGLKELYEDENVDFEIQLEARLSYARTVCLTQIRGMNNNFDSVDVEKLYLEIIQLAGKREISCTTAMYLGEYYLEEHLKYMDKNTADKMFDFLEYFIRDYPGEKNNLVYIHLYVEKLYVEIGKDYVKSFHHLKTAYDIGITVRAIKRNHLYKLGRMSDIKLSNYSNAKIYYEEYLHLFPNSIKSALVRRYLKELEVKHKKPDDNNIKTYM
jgi:hypothetical protein